MDEWMSPSAEAWMAMHVLYQNIRKGGFTRWEALILVAAILRIGNEEGQK